MSSRAHPDGSDYPADDCPMRATYLDGEVHHITDEILWHKDGSSFPVEYTSTPITQNDELVGSVVMFRDISERLAAEAELKASVDRFGILFERSPDAYLILNGDRFTSCNQAAVDLLGYDNKEELLGLDPAELSPEFQPDGKRSDEEAAVVIDLAFAQDGHRFDWMHLTKEGEELPAEVILTPIKLDGRQVLLTVWHDLTERKKAEEEIKRVNFLTDIALELTGSGYWHIDYSNPEYY